MQVARGGARKLEKSSGSGARGAEKLPDTYAIKFPSC
jgi:hypothetical protein